MEYDLEMGIKRCRAMASHAFEPFTPLQRVTGAWRVASLRCVFCTTERYDTLSVYGEVIGRRYVYPDGYSREAALTEAYRLDFYKEYEKRSK